MGEVGDERAPDWAAAGGEALFHAVFDASSVIAGIIEVLDGDYRYVIANRAAAAVFGLGDGELSGRAGSGLGLAEDLHQGAVATLKACVASGQTQRLEYPVRLKSGERRWLLGAFSPIPGDAPRVSLVAIDITDRRRAQATAEAQGARLALALEVTGLGIWEYNVPADIVTWDARTRELFGVGPDLEIDFATYVSRIHPDDLPAFQAAYEGALAGANGGRYTIEHRTWDAEGRARWIRGAARVYFDAEGRPIRVIGTAQDITEQVTARERQALLLAELNHRVKNNLAAVQAIASHTLRAHRDDMAAFREAFQSRLMSLARGQELLTRTAWTTPALAEVLDVALSPFEAAAIVIEAPPGHVRVAPELAINMVLVLHELATNAAKYGALSCEGGDVRIGWRIDAGALVLEWRERGGPPVAPPQRNGFGTRLKDAALRGFGGTVESDFAPEGLVCRLRLPLSEALSIDSST